MHSMKQHKPSHWSSMASDVKFERVEVDVTSDEFKSVERLFRKTMKNDQAVIVSIERVQNPFLWEKYCR